MDANPIRTATETAQTVRIIRRAECQLFLASLSPYLKFAPSPEFFVFLFVRFGKTRTKNTHIE